MSELTFCPAPPEDKERILALQVEVFHKEQGIPVDMITQDDPTRRWWCAYEGTELVGTLAAWEEADGTHMGRFILIPRCRGQKAGTRLLRYALEETFAAGIPAIVGEARDVTVHILLGMGAEITGQPFAFFKGNVTPFILRKEAYYQNKKA